jgi:outer membrane protein assembly factor BamB
MGPDHVLRNARSKPNDPAWTDDLAARDGHNYRMPESVDFSFSGSMQPILSAGRVFVADLQSKVYAIDVEDGTTLWQGPLPGGSIYPGVAGDSTVAFASIRGVVVGFDVRSGRVKWRVDTRKAITSAPALVEGICYVASQSGRVYGIEMNTGRVGMRSEYLGAPILGGLCVRDGKVYVGTEAMEAIALQAATGKVLARQTLPGQSFRMLWPVATGSKVIFTTVPAICVGSEYVNDPVLAGTPGVRIGWQPDLKPGYPDLASEQQALGKWLAGKGAAWQTCFALDPATLRKDYIVATGATEGCGTPPNPPTLDGSDRPLVWWATAYPTLTASRSFGTNFTNDLGPFDPQTGRRIPIDNGRLAGQTQETDNLYALTVGGDYVFLRQTFRGTTCINLKTSRMTRISAMYRRQDGGRWLAAVNYAAGRVKGNAVSWPDSVRRVPESAPCIRGRAAPAIGRGVLLQTEPFAVTCIEHAD